VSPRPNPQRRVFAEDHVAERIKSERAQRGWTLESLAKRMEAVGCPIQPSGLFKIERAEGRRRITVDELVAFGQVFGIPIGELTLDPSLAVPSAAAALIEELWHAMERQRQATATAEQAGQEWQSAYDRLVPLLEAHPSARDVVNRFVADQFEWSKDPGAVIDFAGDMLAVAHGVRDGLEEIPLRTRPAPGRKATTENRGKR
jgi:transcriptional regulator with XRE-family HTH domain